MMIGYLGIKALKVVFPLRVNDHYVHHSVHHSPTSSPVPYIFVQLMSLTIVSHEVQ